MDTKNLTKIIHDMCKVSMCDPVVETDFDDIDDTYKSDTKEHFIIEFGTTNPKITVTVGQNIMIDDIIAYMDDIPVRSKITGTITEVYERYIVGKYNTDINELLAMYNLSEGSTDSDIMKQFNLKL